MLSLGQLYTDDDTNDANDDDANNGDTNDDDSNTQWTNHDCIGSLACVPIELKIRKRWQRLFNHVVLHHFHYLVICLHCYIERNWTHQAVVAEKNLGDLVICGPFLQWILSPMWTLYDKRNSCRDIKGNKLIEIHCNGLLIINKLRSFSIIKF